MNRILLLGGTAEGLQLARRLPANTIYSLAGVGQIPNDLSCKCHVGGFGGAAGLSSFIQTHRITLLLDLTHPYAEQISRHAREAATLTGIAYWALRRLAWQPCPGDDWQEWQYWQELMPRLARFSRPLFALGREPLGHLNDIPSHQHWLIRCLKSDASHPQITIISARGPFYLEEEHALLRDQQIDVIVCKNSGSAATEAKLNAARTLKIPILMRQRPELPVADRTFLSVEALSEALA